MHFWPWGEAWFLDGHNEVCCVVLFTNKQRCSFDGVRLHGSMKGLADKFAKLGHYPVDEFIGSIILLPGLTVGSDAKAVGMVRLYLEDFDPYGEAFSEKTMTKADVQALLEQYEKDKHG
jgi:hypothetical protein